MLISGDRYEDCAQAHCLCNAYNVGVRGFVQSFLEVDQAQRDEQLPMSGASRLHFRSEQLCTLSVNNAFSQRKMHFRSEMLIWKGEGGSHSAFFPKDDNLG